MTSTSCSSTDSDPLPPQPTNANVESNKMRLFFINFMLLFSPFIKLTDITTSKSTFDTGSSGTFHDIFSEEDEHQEERRGNERDACKLNRILKVSVVCSECVS